MIDRLNESIGFRSAARVVRVIVERRETGLTLSLSLFDEAADCYSEIVFDGVTQLRVRGEPWDLNGLVLLQAEDISSRSWEGIRFRVKDYEEEFMDFYCANISTGC